jgi:hypothetical protein
LNEIELKRKDKFGGYLDTCGVCINLSKNSDELSCRVTVNVPDETVDDEDKIDYDSWDGWYSPEFGRMPNDEE